MSKKLPAVQKIPEVLPPETEEERLKRSHSAVDFTLSFNPYPVPTKAQREQEKRDELEFFEAWDKLQLRLAAERKLLADKRRKAKKKAPGRSKKKSPARPQSRTSK